MPNDITSVMPSKSKSKQKYLWKLLWSNIGYKLPSGDSEIKMANLQGETSLTSDKYCKNGTANCSADIKAFQRICDGITKASKVWQAKSGTCCPAKYDDLLSRTLPSSQAIRWRHKSMLSKIHWWMVLRFDSKVHEGCMVDGCVPQIVYRRRLLALAQKYK